jgi:hypothetical protein
VKEMFSKQFHLCPQETPQIIHHVTHLHGQTGKSRKCYAENITLSTLNMISHVKATVHSVICEDVLSNSFMLTAKLKRHFDEKHHQYQKKSTTFFKKKKKKKKGILMLEGINE